MYQTPQLSTTHLTADYSLSTGRGDINDLSSDTYQFSCLLFLAGNRDTR